jgi:hypothetical protein
MPEIIKKNLDVALALGIGLVLAISGIMGMMELVALPDFASAATGTVGVTATVNEWLTFSVSTTSVALSPDLVDSAGGTHVGSSTDITLNLGTNSANGWSISVKGATPSGTCANGGLVNSASSSIAICQPSVTSTLAAGTDGYGANATATLADVTIAANYNYWGSTTVGELDTTDSTLASKNSPNAATNVVTMKVYAACDALQPSGQYTDTITLTAVATP